MIILFWNVKILGESDKRAGIRDLCCLNKVDIMCFQETKLSIVSSSLLRSLPTSQDTEWACAEAECSAGELLIGWNSQSGLGSQKVKGYIFCQ